MKRKYIVISMALLSAVSTWAQEITGTVTDALGSPVAGAKYIWSTLRTSLPSLTGMEYLY